MKHVNLGDSAIGRLEQALKVGVLPRDARRYGKRLLEKLRTPVSVLVLGPSGTGKSSLVNMLAGKPIIPLDSRVSELELCWGPETRTIMTYDDGSHEAFEGIQLTEDATNSVRVEVPLPVLNRVKLFDVRVDFASEDPLAQILWAVSQADIILWCSQTFSPEELALWSMVPEELKDHAFFVLSGADLLAAEGILEDQLKTCSDIAGPEFHSLLPVATSHGLAALGENGVADAKLWRSSGAAVLVETILQHAETGRQADLDSVLLFLKRYGISENMNVEDLAYATRSVMGVSKINVPREPRRRTRELSRPPKTNGDKARQEAVAQLADRGESLEYILDLPSVLMSTELLSLSIETAETVAATLAAAESDAAMLADTAMEVAEMLLLYQIEGRDATEDAFRLLLQLRRELEQDMDQIL